MLEVVTAKLLHETKIGKLKFELDIVNIKLTANAEPIKHLNHKVTWFGMKERR